MLQHEEDDFQPFLLFGDAKPGRVRYAAVSVNRASKKIGVATVCTTGALFEMGTKVYKN
jgi:hypothetical protein